MESFEKLRQIRLFLFDMDGTLYLGNRLFGFTRELLATIRQRGKHYLFITNNSSKSVEAYVEKLTKMGVPAAPEDFLTASQATALYLQAHHPETAFYVCGTRSLRQELEQNGIVTTDSPGDAGGVVMGNDTELTFGKLLDVSRILTEKDVPYIATNPDYVCPTEFGYVPDCGSFCDCIFNATGRRPVFIGKPSARMIALAMEKKHIAKEQTAVVGDRIYTDVKSGLNAGALSILVLSGETTPEILQTSEDRPDMVLPDAGVIVRYL